MWRQLNQHSGTLVSGGCSAPHREHGNDWVGSEVTEWVEQEIPNMVNSIGLFWSITEVFIIATQDVNQTSVGLIGWKPSLQKRLVEVKEFLMRLAESDTELRPSPALLKLYVLWSSSVLRWGARKQSSRCNNHPGCLNQTWGRGGGGGGGGGGGTGRGDWGSSSVFIFLVSRCVCVLISWPSGPPSPTSCPAHRPHTHSPPLHPI